MDIAILKEKFFESFGNRTSDPVIFFSPGRVNLIGEHTDYNNGFVLPAALNFGTYLAAAINESGIIRLRTLNFSYSADADAGSFEKNRDGEWVNYPLGVAEQFIKRGYRIPGIDLLYSGDIPNGAGLSSSASIEMATAVALNHLLEANLPTLELVKMSQAAENSFVGMNCGIMDQFAVGFGVKENAIFLNCGNLRFSTVPVELGQYSLVIVNTNKRRALTDSKYNERRAECEEAVRILNRVVKTESLSDLGPGEVDLIEKEIKDDTIRRRALHVVTENGRVLEAVRLLHISDLEGFGRMMNLSHDSLRINYEVTGTELDTLVYEARKIDGVIGSRMTGAGFGGCTVNIVKKTAVGNFTEALGRIYRVKTGLDASFYIPTIENGAHLLTRQGI